MTPAELLNDSCTAYGDGLAFGTIDPATPCDVCGDATPNYAMGGGVCCRQCAEDSIAHTMQHVPEVFDADGGR